MAIEVRHPHLWHPDTGHRRVVATGRVRGLTTVGCRQLRFDRGFGQQLRGGEFDAFYWRSVPFADNHNLQERSFVAEAGEAKAVIRIVGSLLFPWLDSVQR